MEISKEEYMKILDYILENYNDLVDGYYFSNDFLIQIRNYVKGRRLDDDFMLNIHEQLLIKYFLDKHSSFNEDTPVIFTSNDECINKAINNDIFSINYIYYVDFKDEEFKERVINLALNNNYILSNNSPLFFKSNYDVATNSIKYNYLSSNYINFDHFDDNLRDNIIELILQTDYILNDDSSKYLRKNKKIILHSLNIDINTYKYSLITFNNDYDIFKVLLDNNYSFKDEELELLKNVPISYLKSYDILNKILEILDIYYYDDNSYKELFSKLYISCLNNYPTIDSFNGVIEYLSECSWKEYQIDNNEKLVNIFRKIISFIKYSNDYQDFKNKFESLGSNMEYILEDKYYLLDSAIKEYYSIYHSNSKDKKRLEQSSFVISKLSSLYIAKAKELHKKSIKNKFYDKIKDYFTPRLDNKIINKRILQYIKKDIFNDKYINDDKEVLDFITRLKDKYIDLYGNWLCRPINRFFDMDITKLYLSIKRPNNYCYYLKYIESLKLINRLNNGYIKYNDLELNSYRDIIIKDNNGYKCIIDTNKFNINDCKNYQNKEYIFKRFIKEVMLYINSIKVNEKIVNKYLEDMDLNRLLSNIPFNDEFYEFDRDCFYINSFSLEYFIYHCMNTSEPIDKDILLDKMNYDTIYNLLKNNSFIWLWLFDTLSYFYEIYEITDCKKNSMITIYNNINKINNLSYYLNIDINKYSNILLLNKISDCSDNINFNLFNANTIKGLCINTDYTSDHDKKEIIDVASDLICQMAKKDKRTVPYVNGYLNGYYYSVYDDYDEDVLLTGSLVDSCLKVCGNDNDFLHYLALDKNGFIIKITDEVGNFIGRAAGIRNGNIIYINQLRTIYDKGGNGYCSNIDSESYEIIEVFKRACEDIINISQNNVNEKDKIDYIFVTQSYLLEKYKVDKDISILAYKLIGDNPADLSTNDWRYFVNNTNNLMNTKLNKCFITDYDEYNLICIASSKDLLECKDIKVGDVEALYDRSRNKLIVSNNINNEIIRKINKIRTIYNYYHENNIFLNINIDDDMIVIIGDNWYLIFKDKIVDYCIQDFDNNALREFEIVKNILCEYNNFEAINKIKKLF